MKSRTPSLLKSRKAQFFILSVVAIVGVLYFLSRWLEPTTTSDASSIVLIEEPFVFNNIKEKAVDVVKLSKDCEELNYNLREYKTFVENYVIEKNYLVDLDYSYLSCASGSTIVSFQITLVSTRTTISSSFSVGWS